MMKRDCKNDLKIGMKFKKGGVTLTLVSIKNQEALLHRTYVGIRRIYEQANVNHIRSCPNTYKRIEV